MSRIRSAASRLSNDERGTVTIEFVLWVPLVMVLLLMTLDVSQIFLKQAQAMRLVQDANRAFSVGRFRTEGETEQFVRDQLQHLSDHVAASTVVTAGIISTTAKIPLSDLIVTRVLPVGANSAVTIQSSHMMEF